MDIFFSFVGLVFGVTALSIALLDHFVLKEKYQGEQCETKRLQSQNTTGQTIIADSILDYIREASPFLDKDLVISRLRDAMIGLGYYPADRLKVEPTGDNEDTDD